MTNLSAHAFPDVHAALGVDLRELGCIMLDTKPGAIRVGELLAELGAQPYVSPDPAKFWIKGIVGDETAHVTLLYGLIESGVVWRNLVDRILDGWKSEPLKIADVGYFASPYPDEPYWCLIAHLDVTENLLEANARLRFLPHVDTFPEYRPHVTLAYIRGDEAERDRLITELSGRLTGREIEVSPDLNYGGTR